MHVISKKALDEFVRIYPDADEPLMIWYRAARNASWRSIVQVRQVFPHADAVGTASGRIATVFNIAGNKYRLIVGLHYNRQKVYVLRVLSHAEYNRGRWKDEL